MSDPSGFEKRLYLGIDPGQAGALALVEDDCAVLGLWLMPVVKMGKRSRKAIDGAGLFELLKHRARGAVPVVEKVGGMPGQSAPAAFNFGCGYGFIIQSLHALRALSSELDSSYPAAHLVTPQAWKKKILAGTDKSKGSAILAAKRIFPSVSLVPKGCKKEHDGMAEALLLAEFGRQCRLF